MWLKLQAEVDLYEARRALGADLAKLKRLRGTDAPADAAAAE
jgi:hypothetical protein